MSGLPGSFLLCSLNRKPAACSALRTMISGLVSLLLIAAIMRLRVALSTVSTNGAFPLLGRKSGFKRWTHVHCDGLYYWHSN